MIAHTLLTFLFFLSIFLFPWYVTILFALLLVAIAPGYEIVIGGLVLDFTYGAVVPDFLTTFFFGPLSFTIFFGIIYVLSYFIKKRLVFYQDNKI